MLFLRHHAGLSFYLNKKRVMTLYQEIFKKNVLWVDSKTKSDPNYFTKLADDHTPDFLYIGCSDSRVPANEIMGMEPGDLFVHRNISNMVANTDLNVLSVINYAILHLKVKHIIVCGHYNCGGVKAAMQSVDLGLLNPWLRGIRDVYRMHKSELDAIPDPVDRYNRLVELNVIEQCINVTKTAEVQEMYSQFKYPVVHGWVFDLRNGLLKDLNFDFEEKLRDIQEIYNLSGRNWF